MEWCRRQRPQRSEDAAREQATERPALSEAKGDSHKNKKMKRFYKLTPYILIFFSSLIFFVTISFKTKAEENFLELDTKLNSLKLEKDVMTREGELKQDCIPFTYFDEKTEVQLEKLFSLERSDFSEGEYKSALESGIFELENLLHRRQQSLIFGFDRMMYSSLILVLIAVIVIIYDLFSARNELNRTKTINEQQIKFSRDLHDGVAQDLAALKVYIEKKDENRTHFYADQALKEVRYLIDSMHRDFSKPFDATVSETLCDFENNYGIKTHLMIVSENLNRIQPEKQMELLRILQEALSNIARHADADEVTVQFTEVGEDLKFNIKDNGVGFERLSVDSEKKKHYGVKNIEERVLGLGGSVQFINQGGTTIAITIKDFVR